MPFPIGNRSFICLLALLCLTAIPARGQQDAEFVGQSFEEARVPAAWHNQGLDLAVSDRHYKEGRQSLRWQWRAGQSLLVREPAGLRGAGESKNGGVYLWVYNETPTDGALTFRFGTVEQLTSGQPAPYQFQFNLDFKGWRAGWVYFREDAVNPAYRGPAKVSDVSLEAMQVVAPADADRREGTLFFDRVEFSTRMQWHRTPDYQTPLTNPSRAGPDVSAGALDAHKDLNALRWMRTRPTEPLAQVVTAEQKQAFQTIARRYDQWLLGNNLDPQSHPAYRIRHEALEQYIRSGKEQFKDLNIQRKDGVITGVPLFSIRGGSQGSGYQHVGGIPITDVFQNIILPLALDWKLNKNEESKQHFFDVIDHAHDQGWAAGSSMGSLDHATLRVAGYMHSVYIMRGELEATGRLDRELAAMRWYTYFNGMYAEKGVRGASADLIRTTMFHKLLMVLAMEDSPEKVRDMHALMRWQNRALAIAPGWADTIKPDYTGFHHRGVYPTAYAPEAYQTASLVYWLQHDTPFEMSAQSAHNLRQALLTQRMMMNKYHPPMSIGGRWPFGKPQLVRATPSYAYMALSGDPIDREMAAAFMRLWMPEHEFFRQGFFPDCRAGIMYVESMGSLQLMVELAGMGIEPEPAPAGNWIKPYGALMFHRRDDWMLSVKGWSKYVWDFEVGGNENMFGRYLSYGMLQILGEGEPITPEASGYVMDGWDWNRLPGTTAIRLPLSELIAKNRKMRDFTDQTFVGGVSLGGRDGLFAMRLHDTEYNPSFYASKSVFAFDDRVICLGSGIVNNDAQHSTETTLFQTYLPSPGTPTWIGTTESVTAFPVTETFGDGRRVWLMDAAGNGYLVPNADALHVARHRQESIDQTGKNETQGDFATAWIDHGTAPRDAGYEYAILVQAESPEQVAAFAAEPGYEVLRQDDQVHAVRDLTSGAVGYAIFDAEAPVDLDLLQRADTPCMVMLRPEGDRLVLGVANPDLGLIPPDEPQPTDITEGLNDRGLLRSESPETTVQLTLTGRWELASDPGEARIARTDGNATVLEVTCQHGLTTDVTLRRR